MGGELKSTLPLEKLYDFLSKSTDVEIWEKDIRTKHRGRIVGFDEYMNLVIDNGAKRYLLKGDCVCVVLGKDTC
ncbi:LSM domain-containing protein [Encephalitozoon hellem ATCC 50504]|uniref:RNA-binding protein Hfq n=1 Tax=Encephalitozoon hellem TaxID=27973 RepID=A0A9Q9C976_ENCHE|nr:LSM domain-containing protein [Encephalitozoon hellem ATCC 50504]AFM97849.1 LSM domain-containing protein [Encephalitozoon hellem ATCC 50504]UTX42628.1 RNA-binding protein Hfq [Encephalitozoon hellem]WEL38084.1 small nuclear ribonucleoprotein E [Encephalitozoon hellem]|eukprot:XP_003886830.1 LSM domain-containing protein [Encephalitozoon hellem ATCC 50504]